ncbi:hypothetical protein, partial [Pseudomonas syringae]
RFFSETGDYADWPLWSGAFEAVMRFLLNALKVTRCDFLVLLVTVRPASASSRRLAKLLLSARFLISHKAEKASTA